MSRSKRSQRNKAREQRAAVAATNSDPSVPMPVPKTVALGFARQTTMYSGPFPSPDMIREYDAVCPGLGERLMMLMEDQARHRMALEKQVVASDIHRSWGGLICGLIVALAFLAGGVYVAKIGHPAAGGTIATAAVVGLVTTFVYGTRSQRQERVEKAKIMTSKK